MSFLIRVATRADEPQVQEVIKSVYDEYSFTWDPAGYHADLFDLEEHYFAPGHQFWVSEIEGRVVGTVALCFHPVIAPELSEVPATEIEGQVRLVGTDCSLERLYIHPDYRRRGIGRALNDHAVRFAASQGRIAMEIWSDKRFREAHLLYQQLGAEVRADRICDDPDVSPEWGLVLPL